MLHTTVLKYMITIKFRKGLPIIGQSFFSAYIYIEERSSTMQVLDRLKMELSNQEYFTDEQYIQFLTENNLSPTDEYDKPTMQKQLLFTVIDVLEAVTNDIDLMTGISTEFSDIGQAYQFLEARIQQVKDKIAAIPEPEEDYSCFSLMYTREPVTRPPYSSNTRIVSNEEIDDMIGR